MTSTMLLHITCIILPQSCRAKRPTPGLSSRPPYTWWHTEHRGAWPFTAVRRWCAIHSSTQEACTELMLPRQPQGWISGSSVESRQIQHSSSPSSEDVATAASGPPSTATTSATGTWGPGSAASSVPPVAPSGVGESGACSMPDRSKPAPSASRSATGGAALPRKAAAAAADDDDDEALGARNSGKSSANSALAAFACQDSRASWRRRSAGSAIEP
mmetsp:Transcript_161403/g.518184  ORF Transcript_161403/g.518184 Transcript_161403/m.518184 type:complete len:216 (+) Transcript_161403:1314-1961(+)